jgi:hypothetical protein
MAVRDCRVLRSITLVSNIFRREYAITEDAIKKQLLGRNKVSLTLDQWTRTNELAIMLVIAYYMDLNRAWLEVQLAFDEVGRLCRSHFES